MGLHHHAVHQANCTAWVPWLAFPAMTIAPGLFSLNFRRDQYLEKSLASRVGTSAGVIAAFILGGFAEALWGFGGLSQRLFFAVLFAWMILVGRHLTRATRVT